MGISINVNNVIKHNTASTLLNSLPQGTSGQMESLTNTVLGNNSAISLTDYAAIKNGSYGKLMRTYFSDSSHAADVAARQSGESTETPKASYSQASSGINANSLLKTDRAYQSQQKKTEEAAASEDLSAAGESLQKSSEALLSTGKDAVFGSAEYDREKASTAVQTFVKDYNSMVDAAKNSKNAGVTRAVSNMTASARGKQDALAEVGISFDKDTNKLSVDARKLQNADADKLRSLFQEEGSIASQASSASQLVNYYGDAAQDTAKQTYGTNGNYNTNSVLNSLYNGYM